MSGQHRYVSPSLMSATRRLRGPSARRDAPARKRKLPFRQAADEAMDSLDDLARAGDVSSNAYNVLAKKLKDVHDSADAGKIPVVESVVMQYAMAEPSTLAFAPPSVQSWSPVFVRTLVLKFLSASEDEHCDLPPASIWKDKIVTHYMGLDCCVLDEARIRDAIELFTTASPDQFVTPIVANLNRLYKNMAMSAWEIFEEDGDEMVRLAETSPPFREALISLLDETNKEQFAVRQRLYAMRKDGDILPCHHDLVEGKRAHPFEGDEDIDDDSDMSGDLSDTNPGTNPDTNPDTNRDTNRDTNPESGRVHDREHNDSEIDEDVGFESYEECECPRCLAMQDARSAIRLREELDREPYERTARAYRDTEA